MVFFFHLIKDMNIADEIVNTANFELEDRKQLCLLLEWVKTNLINFDMFRLQLALVLFRLDQFDNPVFVK